MIRPAPLLLTFAIAINACDRRPVDGASDAGDEAKIAVSTEPMLDIPGTLPDGSAAYAYASDATRLAGGGIVVADGDASSVRYFDHTGALVRTVGRSGRGPGEFTGPQWIEKCSGDSIFVWDGGQAEMSVLDAEGRIGREFKIRPDVYELACSRTGAFIGIGAPMIHGPMSEKGERVNTEMWIFDANGKETASIGQVAYAEFRPLGRRTRFAIDDRRAYVGITGAATVDVYSYKGERVGSIESGVKERKPTQAHYDRAIEEMLVQVDKPMRESARAMTHRIPMPKTLPAYSEMFTDPASRLWMVTSALGDGSTRLRAIGPDAKVIGDVTIPLDLKVFEIGEDYVLGMYQDQDEEQHVLVYDLHL